MLFYCRADLKPGLDEAALSGDMEALSVGVKDVAPVIQPMVTIDTDNHEIWIMMLTNVFALRIKHSS